MRTYCMIFILLLTDLGVGTSVDAKGRQVML